MRIHPLRALVPGLGVAVVAAVMTGSSVSAGDPGSGSWPMWGGTPDRNMVR
jgi:hypothetical protein